MANPRKILVTSALPYANGPIHIGHLVEYIQTDIWVKFQKLRGNKCIYLCADDTHGTAIMMSAQRKGCSEEEWIAAVSEEHQRDFAGFGIEFDNYGSTNSPENYELCKLFWQSFRNAGLVRKEAVTQLFDDEKGIFLADRFVRGTCPKCAADDQYGDSCDQCGATYSAREIINPVSTLSDTTPSVKTADHLFIQIEKLHDFLDQWTQSGEHLQSEIANYLKGHFLNEPLRDWDVSRPEPYFGFEIPDAPGHFWFVWFDAPIGYMASTKQYCDRTGEDFESWWKDPSTEIYHFIGKDITYFHTLFWPAMLKVAEFTLPKKIHIHGFLTVDGRKMSKRDGTFVKAETFLKHLNPAALRYYYASKLNNRVEDLDLNLKEFTTKVNTDLVGKVVNLASRTAKFVQQTGLSPEYPEDGGLFQKAAEAGDAIAAAYEACDFNRAIRLIIELADQANPYVESHQPWNLRKDPERQQELQDVCTVALNLFRQIAIYLQPVLPEIAEKTNSLLGDPIVKWEQAASPLTGTPVKQFEHMMKRIEEKDVNNMIEESKDENETVEAEENTTQSTDSAQPLIDEPLADEITFEEFAKVDLRVARVVKAEHVEEANKLLKLTLSLGGDETRQVFAGIKKAYNPEDLDGRLVVMVANLAPRKMRFGISEGMITAAGPGGEEVFMLAIDEGAQPGQRVH
ncbi:MAG: methionine--tRNA ligase [Planctomycetaceae bacterium]|nr:methionine--tRNA ligase [Planctomycetaceae bacterium]|tara:strand:- start:1892 stop:3940 length:2049 start_codon:yes stop_codon:yes gene_type:complete